MKKQFRIYLHSSNAIAEKLTLLAAKSNTSANPLTIGEMVSIVKADKLAYPNAYEDIVAVVIDNHSITVKDGNRTLVVIEETLVHELVAEDN